ncbi:MAG: thiolase family protein [Verrucomicrobiales bacterium]
MKPVHILAATRTPFCRMGTELAELSAADLGTRACAALLTQAGLDPDTIAETLIGCVAQPADSANIARIIALRAGLPQSTPAMTVHRNCASGLEALTTAAERIQAGRGELYLVGGTESMSNIPFLYPKNLQNKLSQLSRAKTTTQKLSTIASLRLDEFLHPVIGLQVGLTDPVSGLNMGQTAEVLAREFDISREEQDVFAAESHRKALASANARASEISPLHVDGTALKNDNGPRADSTREKLATLRPVFEKNTGTVTAGNSSQVTDGAVALLLGTEEAAHTHGLTPLGRVVDYAYTGCDPKRMGLGPVHAIADLQQRSGLTLADADLVELNEAFAAQSLACLMALKDQKHAARAGLEAPLGEIPAEKLNPRGGAIALGHPVGATGARLVHSALSQLHEKNLKRALVTLCVGGGQGAALWLET